MGAYLSTPNTEKISHDESHDQLEFGVSGMQGWRMSMEDAHCSLTNVDGKNNSLFGVFDGHGGKEVAEYCAQNFHKFLMDTDAYTEGHIHKALKEAFLSIDEAILSEEVIEELKQLGGLTDHKNGEGEEDEAAMLLEEANMPIGELLERLKGNVKENLKQNGLFMESEEEEEEETSEENKDVIQNGKSKSRKQKKPIKRSANGEVYQNEEASSGSALSSSTSAEASIEQANSSSGSATNIESKVESNGAGSSNGVTTTTDANDKDFQLDEDDESDDDDEEEDDDDDDDDDDESESEEEFEDSAGVDFQEGSDEVGKDSGTTAIVALIHNNKLYVANVGDSRCILCRNGKPYEMSFDHKPEDEIERTRIEKAGCKITGDGRVNGGLNLSRAVGDHTYKQNKDLSAEEQAITVCPDIKETELTDDDDFMVLACDGIWNMMSNEEVIEFVKERLNNASEEKLQLSKICEELFDHCMAPDTDNDGSGCDNMTCQIVRFKRETSYGKPRITTSQKQKRTNDSTDNDLDRDSKKSKLSSMD